MVSNLRASVEYLDSLGFLNVVLPFLFVFTIIFALLEKTKVFGVDEKGKTKKNINSMTAFLIGFIFISFMSQVESLITYLQYIGMFLVFLMGVFYLFALFRVDLTTAKFSFIPIVLFLVVIGGFLYAMGFLNNLEYDFVFEILFSPVTIMIVSFFGIIWYITSGGSSVSVVKDFSSRPDYGSTSPAPAKENSKLAELDKKFVRPDPLDNPSGGSSDATSGGPSQYPGAKHVRRIEGDDLGNFDRRAPPEGDSFDEPSNYPGARHKRRISGNDLK